MRRSHKMASRLLQKTFLPLSISRPFLARPCTHYTYTITDTGEKRVHKIPTIKGISILRDPRLNKGKAFTLKERQILGLHGLLPPMISDQDSQVHRVWTELQRQHDDLSRYIQLMSLQDRNERLFYRVLSDYIEELMPVVYTPTVGLACQRYGLTYRRPRGLFVSIHDRGHIPKLLDNWPEDHVKAIVVTDGERILGLGDLGCYGMGIPIGKLALYTACALIDPAACLPVLIDVGTDNDELRDSPYYTGIRQKRDRSLEYDKLVDEFIQAVINKYGETTLIQFEDFGNHNAFRFLEKYRYDICTFNDDIQGTAAVTVAGILASLKITNSRLSDHRFVFQGAGEAAIGIADLLVMAMEDEGTPVEEAKEKIRLVDSKGLVVKDRKVGGLNQHKLRYAPEEDHVDNLTDVVKQFQPSAIIGVAAVPHAFTQEICEVMASNNDHPIIFALSNPTSKAECTAHEAYTWTDGKAIFASGSPFDPVSLPDGRHFIPGQGNNAYIFPGVALGVISSGARHVTDEMFLTAARALADQVTPRELSKGLLYPPLRTIQKVSFNVAVEVARTAYRTGQATVMPEPSDKRKLVKRNTYSTDYLSYIPGTYDWPDL